MNSILPVTAGWAKASGPVFKDETKRFTFRLQAKLLPGMPTSILFHLIVTIKGSFIARMPRTNQSLNTGPEAKRSTRTRPCRGPDGQDRL